MTKRIIALAVALVMLCCAIPFAAYADEDFATAEERTAGWDANLGTVVSKLLDNKSSAHWRYVAENDETLSKTMLTYTAFALYDNAWKNGFDKSISIDEAEKILVSLIEKVDADIGESKLLKIRDVLETATDFNDLLQKVNGYVKISDVLTSTEWSTAFKYIEWAIELGDLYENAREDVIDAYAQILSVQAANAYYLDFLSFLAKTSTYDVVVRAANNLINGINESVEDIITGEVLKAGGFTASNVLTTAARIAMETNSYTAVALKVYDIGTSVADTLWNTSNQFNLMDELYTTFFVETAAATWATMAKNSGDAELYRFAMSLLVSLRTIGCDTLYDLKVVQAGGVIGQIKNEIYTNITFDQICEKSFLTLAKFVLFDCDPATYKPVTAVVSVSADGMVYADDQPLYNGDDTVVNAKFFGNNIYSDYYDCYVKTLFIENDDAVKVPVTGTDKITLKVEKIINNEIHDFSFTDVEITDGYVTVDTSLKDYSYAVTMDGETVSYRLNEEFVYPDVPEVDAKVVGDAVAGVIKKSYNETKAKLEALINGFIENLFYKILYTLFPFLAK